MIATRFLVPFVLLSFVLACGSENSPDEISGPEAQRALALFTQFQGALKTELVAAMAAGGPAGAIDRCRTVSPDLEKKLSQQHLRVRRISDRPRNPAHTPDVFEARVLKEWMAEIKAGREPQPVARTDGPELRVMQPIRMQAMCLACHGEVTAIDPATLARIRAAYPNDQATGYRAGDLRGAFSAFVAREMQTPVVDPER